MEELQDFNDFCGWLEEMIEGDKVSYAQLQCTIITTESLTHFAMIMDDQWKFFYSSRRSFLPFNVVHFFFGPVRTKGRLALMVGCWPGWARSENHGHYSQFMQMIFRARRIQARRSTSCVGRVMERDRLQLELPFLVCQRAHGVPVSASQAVLSGIQPTLPFIRLVEHLAAPGAACKRRILG